MDRQDWSVLSEMLEAGADPNQRDKPEKNGTTALHKAAWHGNAQAVQLLVQHRADPNTLDNRGATALHCAAARGHMMAAQALLVAGTNPTVRDVVGETAASLARQLGELELAQTIAVWSGEPLTPAAVGLAEVPRQHSPPALGACSPGVQRSPPRVLLPMQSPTQSPPSPVAAVGTGAARWSAAGHEQREWQLMVQEQELLERSRLAIQQAREARISLESNGKAHLGWPLAVPLGNGMERCHFVQPAHTQTVHGRALGGQASSLFDRMDRDKNGVIDKAEFGIAEAAGLLNSPSSPSPPEIQALAQSLGHPDAGPVLVAEKVDISTLRKMSKEDLRLAGLPMGACVALYEWAKQLNEAEKKLNGL